MALAVDPERVIEQTSDRKNVPSPLPAAPTTAVPSTNEPRPGGLVLAPALARFWRLFRLSVWRAFEHDAFAIAKACAYSSIFTFFPALLVLGSVLATMKRGDVYLREISYALGRILPAGSSAAIAYLRSRTERPVGLLVTTSLLTIWTASGAIISWMDGFRRAYQLPKTWGLVKERMIAISLVFMAGLPLTFATILVAFGSRIETRVLFEAGHEYGPFVLLLWTAIRWTIALLTSIAVIQLIYHNAVPRTQPWHSVLPGAILATLLWMGATAVFGWYLQRSANYSVVYGSLGVGIALLTWMYIISLVILIGAEFNAMLFPRTVAKKQESGVSSQ